MRMKKSNRRSFLQKLGIGSLSTGILPTTLFGKTAETKKLAEQPPENAAFPAAKRQYNGAYTGEYLDRIAFPIGGIGAGMFCLEGTGAISHMSIRHLPDLFNSPAMFAAISIKGQEKGAKVLEGLVPDWKKFGLPLAGNGLGNNTYGLPRFHQTVFKSRFPFATINLGDADLPVSVELTGWSPFTPTDPDNSSLPVGALEYKITNNGSSSIEAVFSYHAKNFLSQENGKNAIHELANGFLLSEAGTEQEPFLKSDFAIFSDQANTTVDHCWFRGGWFDPLTMVWDTIEKGEVKRVPPVEEGAPGASLYVPFQLAPGQDKTIRVMMAWYVPDSGKKHGGTPEEDVCDPASGCCPSPSEMDLAIFDKDFDGEFYKPWYSSRFADIRELCRYWKEHYQDLRRKSTLFKDAFYSSTLPGEVIEAVAANLTILKSPTVLRQYDGRLWNYEGSGDTWGCCHGSCTHVWNYAQAIPHLFPALERSLRHTEFCESQNSQGHQTFRSALPIRPVNHDFYSAADGQLGGIMKVHREWRISGDNSWLKKMYPMVKASMDYCVETWDPGHKGILEEPHHNTYDIEFWGPDGMCTSFYLGALNAISRMGEFLGEEVSIYKELAAKGKAYMEKELFDGEYFIQKIQYTGLRAANPVDASEKSFGGDYSEEAKELLAKEGPKYQYGTGCLSDGVLGSWIARMCGLDDPVDPQLIESHLLAVHRYNLKDDLSDHVNPQRPSFALGDDAGLLLCSWPKGGELSLPFVYSNEVWTGIEYQVASHLMLMGKVREGLDIVRACRDRYDGRIRNPFNEYECGNWYARALASYGLLQGLTGIRYDAVDKTLYIDSKVGDFTSFISTNTGFGTVSLRDGQPSLEVVYGEIAAEKVMVSGKGFSL
jgi:uncharacterized protein (DUF608 family)